jgi:SAM-dependent methyltransferase
MRDVFRRSLIPHADVVDEHSLWDLESLGRASRLADWMFDQFSPAAKGAVVEIGPGIGTFSARLLAVGVDSLLLIEPDEMCADMLVERFATDPRVRLARETVPDSPTLTKSPETFDFALCQNVLEHVEDHAAAISAIAGSLRPGGRLGVLVPAHPRLYGSLDHAFGHQRRYTRETLRRAIESSGLKVNALYSFNLLGVPGWWMKSKSGAESIGAGPLAVYEALVRAWRPIEDRVRLPWGLSLVAHAEKR